jgi:uncharacterized protein YjbI with pentapeptide repeats
MKQEMFRKKDLRVEKGQLFLALCTRNIDSVSFNKIKLNANFSGSDIRKGNLHGVDFSGADLSGAEFRDYGNSKVDLSGCKFDGAKLEGVKGM